MREKEFALFLRSKNKSKALIDKFLRYFHEFEKYLQKEKKTIEKAAAGDAEKYWRINKDKFGNFRHHVSSIGNYYEFLNREDIALACLALNGQYDIEKYKIRNFEGVPSKYINALEKIGLKTADDVLRSCRTKEMRTKISEAANIPVAGVLEITKLSDQARIGGHRKKRARLYYDAGLQTAEQISKYSSREIVEKLSAYVKRTGFKGIPPTFGEAEHSVKMATYLPNVVEY